MESEWLTNWICHSNTSSYVPIYGSTERLNLRNTPLVIAGDVAPSPPMTPRPPMFPGEPASRMASRPHLTSLELDVNDATEAAVKLTYHVALGKSAEQAAGNAFDGGPVQPRTIGLDQLVWMTKQLV